ncbi:MAG: hypothetical protein IID12_05525 [Candidatus Marinimicrobia bacterium]|nr:hypothetical protein [Candidatus Neomarinimicrobiota bacterium]
MNENKTTLIVLSLAISGILITTVIGWYVIHQVQKENQAFQEKVFSQYEYLLADFDIERRVLLMEFNKLMQGVQEISQASKAYWNTPVSRGMDAPKFIGGSDITAFALDSTYEWGTYEVVNIENDHFTLIARGNYTGLEFSTVINKHGIVSWKPVKIPALDRVGR